MKKSEKRRLRIIWLFVFVVTVSAASLLLIWPRYIEARHGVLEERLETAVASLAERRWERPPLGDDTRPGNAVEASIHAARGLAELPHVGTPELDGALRRGEVPPELVPLLDAQADRLDRFRQSAMRSFSRRSGSFDATSEPTLRDRRAGIELLLAEGLREEPLTCGERAAFAIRIAQDASAGGGLGEAAHAADEIDLALDVLPRCFELVGDEALAELGTNLERLAETFRMLAENPVPVGDSLEHAALSQALELARETAPSESPLDVLRIRTTLERPAQLNVLDQTLDIAARFVKVDTFSYPALLSEAATLVEELPLDLEADLGRRMDALFVLRRQGEVVARLRAAAVALRDLAAPTEGAPAWLMERSLADPFDGAPLRFRVETDALVVWSVGHDGIDHRGSIEPGTGGAPTDVVVRLRTRRAPPEPPAPPPEAAVEVDAPAPRRAPLTPIEPSSMGEPVRDAGPGGEANLPEAPPPESPAHVAPDASTDAPTDAAADAG